MATYVLPGGCMKRNFSTTLMSGILASVALSVSLLEAVPKDKNHQDAFMPGEASESEIAQEVRHQLVLLPYYTVFDDLAFNVNGSTVTLLGAVTRPVLKDDAQNVVKRVKGVTQVINNIEVLP